MPAEGRSPFVGTRPFETSDKEVFFGREREAPLLKGRVIGHPLVLLYAQSGAGKTSLVNASLIPDLEAEGFQVLPVTRLHQALPIEGASDIGNVYVFNAVRGLRLAHDVAPPSSIATALKAVERERDEVGELRPLVWIIDQFEELFSAYPERWQERPGFLRDLTGALGEIPALRVLLAMREDYIAHLDPYLGVFRDRLAVRMRLELLRESEAIRAVERPLGVTPRRFSDGVAKKIVDELLHVRTRNERGEIANVRGEFVEPVQLQVVCRTLWESLPPDLTWIDDHQLKRIGDVDEALRTFYDGAIAEAAKAAQKGSELLLREWIEKHLITPAGTRGMVYEGEELTKTLPAQAIERLVSAHVIRGETRHGLRWFELAHDRFLKPVHESNLEFIQKKRTDAFAGQTAMIWGGLAASIAVSGLLMTQANAWVTGLVLFLGAVLSGIGLGALGRMLRKRMELQSAAIPYAALALIALHVFLLYWAIDHAKWWEGALYVLGLAIYLGMGFNGEFSEKSARKST